MRQRVNLTVIAASRDSRAVARHCLDCIRVPRPIRLLHGVPLLATNISLATGLRFTYGQCSSSITSEERQASRPWETRYYCNCSCKLRFLVRPNCAVDASSYRNLSWSDIVNIGRVGLSCSEEFSVSSKNIDIRYKTTALWVTEL